MKKKVKKKRSFISSQWENNNKNKEIPFLKINLLGTDELKDLETRRNLRAY